MIKYIMSFFRQESGQTLGVYALVLILVVMVVIISLALFGQNLLALLQNVTRSVKFMALQYLLLVTLLMAMLCVVYYDGRWRRIPNFITLPLMVIGVLVRFFMHDWSGFYLSLLGILAGAGLLLPVYLLRGLGGGDLKLMAAIGACVGLRLIGAVLFLTIVSGGLLALLWIFLRRSHLKWRPLPPLEQYASAATLPYGWAIVAGTVLAIYIHPLEVWL